MHLRKTYAPVRAIFNEDASINQAFIQPTFLEALVDNIDSSITSREFQNTKVLLALPRVIVRGGTHELKWVIVFRVIDDKVAEYIHQHELK